MNELEKSIVNTLKYSSLFNFPLTKNEIYKFLISDQPYSIVKIEKALERLTFNKVIFESNNHYYISDEAKQVIEKREKWKEEVVQIYNTAKQELEFLNKLWFVNFVGITGSVAAKSLRPGYDIDLFIITNSGLLWITRFITVVYLKYKKLYKSKYCANIYISTKNLTWKDKNVYVANEIVRLLPLFNKDFTYEKFLIKNSWITSFLPNFRHYIPKYNLKYGQKPISYLFLPIETIFFTIQYLYMKRKITTEKVSFSEILFLKNDYRDNILKKFEMVVDREISR